MNPKVSGPDQGGVLGEGDGLGKGNGRVIPLNDLAEAEVPKARRKDLLEHGAVEAFDLPPGPRAVLVLNLNDGESPVVGPEDNPVGLAPEDLAVR